MPEQKQKNLLSKAGYERTDSDYINEFNLDASQDVNAQMFDAVEEMNYKAYLEAGMSEGAARARAMQRKKMAMEMAKDQLK